MSYEANLTRATVFFAASLVLSGLHGTHGVNLTCLGLGLLNFGIAVFVGVRETR